MHTSNENILLLEKIKQNSIFDWRLLENIYYEDYIWWTYLNIRRNERLNLFIHQLEFKQNNGVPKCIMTIVEFVNKITYFNKKIKHFVWVLTWSREVIIYYSRYYRYLKNERLFGKKNFLNYKHGHKLHFISYIKNRELTGVRLNRNHMIF